ncbi:hypothetical protein ACSSS7_002267 [Eimeria intestinalis]
MPTSDIPGLDEVQRKRVVDKASSCPRTQRLKQAAIDSLLKEVNTCFLRTMNKIAFDIFLERSKDNRLRVDLQLPPFAKPGLPPWHALVHLPAHDFSKTFASFCSTSLHVKSEVIRAMAGIRAECVDILEKRIFGSSITKALKLEEFRQLQRASISQIAYFLQEAWASKVQGIVETNLRSVGKGWFNIYEFNKETYEYGKVKRMLILTRHLMRDALRDMVTESINEFFGLFRSATPQKVEVESLRKVRNVYVESRTQSLYRELSWKGLFYLEVMRSQDGLGFVLSPSPEAFVEAVDDLFDRGVTRMSDIPQPESLVLPHLFKSQQKHIAIPVALDEAPVQASKQGILRLIESHNPYLRQLLALFQTFVDILCLSPADVVAEVEQRAATGNSADVFKQAILGLHEVGATAEKPLRFMLFALGKLQQFPAGLFSIDNPICPVHNTYRRTCCVFFAIKFLVEDHNLRWRLYGSPLEIIELSNEISAALVRDRARFLDEMLLQQVFGGIKALNRVEKILKERGLTAVLAKASELMHELVEFRPLVPIIASLRNEGMRERHWSKLFERIGEPSLDEAATLTLDALLKNNVADHTDFVVELGELALKESFLEKTMKAAWKDVVFEFRETYKDTDTYILKGTEEIIALLDEHMLTTQGLQFSVYKKPHEKEIDEWAALIMTASETLDEWLKCQRSWLYLQPIFQSPDIAKQLPAETKRFNTVDTAWRVLMRHTCEEPHVLAACSTPGVLDKLRENNRLLERVQKELQSYLELKRSQFARFYFLSNEELLEILSESTDPLKVQPFLCKVFENMNELEFSPDLMATAMFSAEGERMPFVQPLVTANKGVEIWMQELEQAMKHSVRKSLKDAINDYACTERTKWVMKHPGQCVLNGSQVHWTAEVEDAINNRQIKTLMDKQTSQLLDLVALVRKGLNAKQSITIGALIVIDVHAKDIVQRLWKEEVTSADAFEWISQLRYYWQDENCWVQCVQTDFPYGYEYLGNTFRLVLTPLTDMAYMTLMGAQQLNLGGSLAGPAGTGKTETTKDLAKALATQCVVFNCSEMMDYIMIAKFFKGLASSGAWCCFDEFNRINIEVLSVIAQQLIVLFGAKAQLLGYDSTLEIDFEDSHIVVQPTFNVFITMNPGYAGRTELPDNLKCLFRPMAMMVPDYSMIAEIMLYSFGFVQARELSVKMVATFKLSSEQLSSQDHYDYGMRAVRSVINAAGSLKLKHSDTDEQKLLLQALRDVNVPKFLSHDLPLFENIIADLFPGIEVPKRDNHLLEVSLLRQAELLRLQPVGPFMEKVLQLYDTVQVRHGIMLVGPTGGGKTSTYKLLAAALSDLHKVPGFAKVSVDVLNPKAVTIGQLYGYFNETTHEWTDGLAAALLRHAIRDTSNEQHWIMFDGPVDALWVESMNSVLDDNKKLCLNSGEIISLTPRVAMMFEVEDLSVASPATVSRCGMVYMEPEVLGFRPLVHSWLKTLPSTIKDHHKTQMDNLCCEFFPGGISILRKQCKEVVTTVNSNLYTSCLRLLQSILSRYRQDDKNADASQGDALSSRIPAAFLFSLVWSCGITAVGKLMPCSCSRFGETIGHNVLCPGPTGTGKSVILTELLLSSLPENYEAHMMTLSAHTRVNQMQHFESSLLPAVPTGNSGNIRGVNSGIYFPVGKPPPRDLKHLRHFPYLFNCPPFVNTTKATSWLSLSYLSECCVANSHADCTTVANRGRAISTDVIEKRLVGQIPFLQVVRCWVHETSRVFCDRLADEGDRTWFYEALRQQAVQFGLEFPSEKEISSIIFADFVQQTSDRHYLEVDEASTLKTVIETYLQDYNSNASAPMQLVMFEDACAHVARICRVLRQPSGHALLLGVRGSGRQSLSRLASFIMETECFQVGATKGEIIENSMLEDINSALNYGDVPNLYKKEDMEEIMKVCKAFCKQQGVAPTKANIFNAYLNRVKSILHFILAMSPLEINFRTWLRMFPSLTNCCTIDWFPEIQQDHALADETKKIVAYDEEVASKKASETQALKDEAQRDLDEALPALEEAVECVKKLKSDHIREVKALTKPPSGVILTMEAVCIMFGVPPVRKPDPSKPGSKIEDYWESAQHKLLKDPKKLLEDLLKYDKDNVPESIIATISPYIDRTDFDPKAIRKASVACEAICMWVRAMFKYYNVAKTVAPKRVKLQQAEAELTATTENLMRTKARLKEVEEKIERLAADFALAVDKKEQLTKEIQSCQKKLQRAEPLLLGLADEKQRWGEQARSTKELFSFISGQGGSPSDPLTIRQWTVWGLPNDELSVQNGIIIDRTRRWPLMIDPQVLKVSDASLMRELEICIQLGKWVLIENVSETLDPALDAILLQQKIKSGSGYCIRIGDKPVPWGPAFRLFLTTKLPNPKFPVDIFVKTTVINFAITPEGLEDQMLGLVVTKEAPQLEERKAVLAQSNADMRRELKALQDKILNVMSQSQGNILDDEVLTSTLQASKQTSEELQSKVVEAETTEREIDEARYMPELY